MAIVAWQGWQIEVPDDWDPARIQGDYNKGMALFATLHGPVIGVRWQAVRKSKRFEPVDSARQVIRREVGKLEADKAKLHPLADRPWRGSMLYQDNEPPGRDIWVGYSPTSKRLFAITYHVRRRDRVLAEQVVPHLIDHGIKPDAATPWSMFELSCRAPAGMSLEANQMLVGDLSLTFARRREWLKVRQIAVASLALARRNMKQIFAEQQRNRRKFYRLAEEPADVTLELHDRPISGQLLVLRRRRRFFMAWKVPKRLYLYCLHDEGRDRLFMFDASSEELVKDTLKTIDWARKSVAKPTK